MWIRWCSQQNQFVCSNCLWIQAHKPQGAPTALLRSVDALEKATEVLDREYQQCEAIKAQVSKLPTLKDASSIEQSLGINNTMFKSMLWKVAVHLCCDQLMILLLPSQSKDGSTNWQASPWLDFEVPWPFRMLAPISGPGEAAGWNFSIPC